MTTDVETHKIKVDEEYKEQALKKIQELVKGNNCDTEEVKLQTFDGEILEFRAQNTLTVLTKLSEKHIAGRVEGPVKVDNEIAAKAAINSAYKTIKESPDIARKIRDVLVGRDDKGFGISDEFLQLPFFKKEFVIFQPCQTCKTTGSVKCLPCSGKGLSPCPRCQGTGMGNCTHCNGAQMINGPNGDRVQCPICHGQGRSMCTQCQQRGTIQCKTCRSAGVTPCQNCNGNAWSSHIHIMEVHARTNFEYPKDSLPEKVTNMIDKHGAKIKDHANINLITEQPEQPQSQQEEQIETEHFEVPVKYDVTLPYGHFEYEIKGNTYYTFLFGTQGRLTHVSPFLDDLIKDGVRKLKDAAELRGDVTENLKAAAQYRTIQEGIIFSALHGKGKAQKALKQKNMLGLSDGLIKDIIETSDIALRNITKKPRTMGMIYAGILNAVLFAAYFFALRSQITANIPNPNMHHLIDALMLGVTAYLGIFTIQMTASSALKNTLNALLPQGMKKSAPPKLGNMLYYSLGISIAIFGGLYAVTVL